MRYQPALPLAMELVAMRSLIMRSTTRSNWSPVTSSGCAALAIAAMA